MTRERTMRTGARALWLKLHLYLGLSAGAVLVLLGLTGSLIVFYPQMDAALDPEWVTVPERSGEPLPMGDIVAAAREQYQGSTEPLWVLLPEVENGAYVVRFDEPNARTGELDAVWFAVDPYTGKALGQRVWGDFAMSWVYELHHSLHLGHFGEHAVGVVGLLLVVSLLTGVYLWWPTLRAGARRALTVKWRTGGARRNQDLHNAGGVYAGIVLLVIGLTGAYVTFAEDLDPVVGALARTTPYPTDLASTPLPGATPIPAEQAVAVADSVFPGAELKYIALPVGAEGVYWIFMRQPGEIGASSAQSQVWVDRYSGTVLAVRDWNGLTPADQVLASMLPLHSGDALGPVGKWLVFLSGFVPLLLYVTGVRAWWRKRGGRRRRAARLAGSEPAPLVPVAPRAAAPVSAAARQRG